jgi:hypothetical protein
MSATIATIAAATTTTATTIDLTAADAFGGFVAMVVGLLAFLSISGLALSMTIGASKSPGTLAITGIAAVLSVIIAIGLYSSLSVRHTLKLDGCPAETWDRLGSVLALIMGITAFLSLGGIVVTSLIGAFSASKSPVSSWPMDQEQSFFGFDRRIQASQSRAWAMSVAAGVFVFLFAFGVYSGIEPDRRDLAKDMNISNITKKARVQDAPKQDAPKQDAPKQDAPKAESPKQ